jgi:hypothetical protein
MSTLQKNEAGFSVIEAVLIIIIIALLTFVGWFVWHSKQAVDKTLAATASSSSPTLKKQRTGTIAKPTTATPVQTVPITTAPVVPQIESADCFNDSSVKPSEIVLACADANSVAENISWTSSDATGAGDVKENDCSPDCANGQFHTYPATFDLSGAQTVGHTTYLTALVVHYTGSYPGQGPTDNYTFSAP